MNRRNQRRWQEIRSVEEGGRYFTAMAVRYNVVDDYDTIFLPGVFNRSLEENLPVLTWNHDWSEVVGRIVSYEDTPEGLVVRARLSDPDAVPRAKQAIAQLRDGDIEDVSVGFGFVAEENGTTKVNGKVAFKEATLNELAVGLVRGAVPGAKVLALRSAPGCVIEAETAGQILAQLQAGQLTLKDALQAVEDASIERPMTEAEPVEEDTPEEEQPEETAVEAVDDQDTEEVQEEAATPEAPYGHDLEELLADVDALLAEKDAAP